LQAKKATLHLNSAAIYIRENTPHIETALTFPLLAASIASHYAALMPPAPRFMPAAAPDAFVAPATQSRQPALMPCLRHYALMRRLADTPSHAY